LQQAWLILPYSAPFNTSMSEHDIPKAYDPSAIEPAWANS